MSLSQETSEFKQANRWLKRIFWLMVSFLVMLGVDIALLTYEIQVIG